MLRILTIFNFVLILNSSAKLFFSEDHEQEHGVNNKDIEPVNIQVDFVNKGDPLWVLSLSGDDWMAPKLRLGNTAELEEFFLYIEPSMKNSRRRRRPAARVKDDPAHQPIHRSISEAKNDFMILINKFALTSSTDADAYLMDNTHFYDNSPSITLHFQGPYSVLIVELGRKQWHYFINSQASLPEWFYEKHDTRDSPILIPEDVKIPLFSSLWQLLHIFFGFPV